MKCIQEEHDNYERETPNMVFDGFCHRNYQDNLDGWMMEQLEEHNVPSVKMAHDILSLFSEVNNLRKENWRLRQRVKLLDNF